MPRRYFFLTFRLSTVTISHFCLYQKILILVLVDELHISSPSHNNRMLEVAQKAWRLVREAIWRLPWLLLKVGLAYVISDSFFFAPHFFLFDHTYLKPHI